MARSGPVSAGTGGGTIRAGLRHNAFNSRDHSGGVDRMCGHQAGGGEQNQRDARGRTFKRFTLSAIDRESDTLFFPCLFF